MEQLFDAFGIDWKLLIAQAINFGVLLAVLTYLLYKPVLKTLDERSALIKKGVVDAEEATKKLEEADDTVKARLQEAEGEAEGLVARARDEAGSERSRIVKEAETRASHIEKDAEARAKEAKEQALKESEREIARLAILAAEKAIRKS
ncbi:MAG: ATP synthase F0 subunit B [Candidatus Pacebacteria bacterium]|nr:ATP synthase F0 subunit B [Candidatus Paceibacterota bacterium]